MTEYTSDDPLMTKIEETTDEPHLLRIIDASTKHTSISQLRECISLAPRNEHLLEHLCHKRLLGLAEEGTDIVLDIIDFPKIEEEAETSLFQAVELVKLGIT